VFVVGGDVSDRCVEPDRVVFEPYPVQLEFEFAGVADLLQVWPLALDVAEQGFDPGLVGGCGRAAELLGDRQDGHELAGGVGPHLRAVVADGEQQRDLPGGGEFGQGVVVPRAASAACSSGLAQFAAASDRSSLSRAAVKATSTWVEDSSAATRVVIHFRDTTSRMAIAARRARLKWVKS
jgi:hypothetical protein